MKYYLEDERILSLQESMLLSDRVEDIYSHISIAMQVEFVSLGGRTMLQPVINAVRYDGLLVSAGCCLPFLYQLIYTYIL